MATWEMIRTAAAENTEKLLKAVNDNWDLMPLWDRKIACGSYGCVFETGIKTIVCKVTDSVNELAGAKFTMNNYCWGIVPIYAIVELNWRWPRWVVWKARLTNFGKIPRDIYQALNYMEGYLYGISYGVAVRNLPKFIEIANKYRDVAAVHAMTCMAKHGGRVEDVHDGNIGQDETGQWIIADFEYQKLPDNVTEVIKTELTKVGL